MATSKELGASGDATVIGQSILISGKLTGDEDLTVRGRVEGQLNLTRTLIVEPTGVVKADVSVRNAIVSGVVVGNINATESVELTREGRMVGDIRSPRVIIVDGASFRGRVDMGEAEAGRQGERAPRPTAAPARPASITPSRPAPAAAPRTATPPRPPTPPARAEARPRGPEPKAEAKPPAPPPPPKAAEASRPVPVALAAGDKKKIMVRKKGR
jgi:cytoskeletal protein CcmA (bactofilin family)